MNLLLDTHIFLWFVNDDPRLSDSLKDLIENQNNFSYLSIASLWEMSIKYNLGKLILALSYEEFVEREIRESGIILLIRKQPYLQKKVGLLKFYKITYLLFRVETTGLNTSILVSE